MTLRLLIAVSALLFLVAAHSAPLLVASFEAPTDLAPLELGQAKVSLSTDHATDGAHGLRISFGVTDYPHVLFTAGKAFPVSDWSPYGAIVFDAFNPEDKPLWLGVRIDGTPGAGTQVVSLQNGAELPPGKLVRIALTFVKGDSFMKGSPPAKTGKVDIATPIFGNLADLSHILNFQFFLAKPDREHIVFLDNVHLAEATPLDGAVDRFGQFTGADWPGKIHSEADLLAQRSTEAAALRETPTPADRDRWGGWRTGPKLSATGWFRTAKVDGKWWLVDPDGRLFWSTGLDCVWADSGSPTKGRENMFTWLPDPGDPLDSFGAKGSGWINFWGINIARKYGPNWATEYLDMTRERMRAWGFNTVAAWSWDSSYKGLRVPFAATIGGGIAGSFDTGMGWMPDCFTDEWAQQVEASIKIVATRWHDDNYCIGYFVDNELPWCGWMPGQEYLLVTAALRLPGDRKVKEAFTGLLRDKYTDVAALNTAWGTSFASWDVFQSQPVVLPEKRNAALEADLSMLLSAFATRYYATVASLIETYGPHKLYLGSRLACSTIEVARASAHYCDVVSYNIYGRAPSVVSRGNEAGLLDKPVIIGEFHFGALDRGMWHTGLGPVGSQEERGIAYEEYVKTALAQPWCVGAHWFTYGDEALTGRGGDGENYNIGFVSNADTPYSELISHATAVNASIYTLRGTTK